MFLFLRLLKGRNKSVFISILLLVLFSKSLKAAMREESPPFIIMLLDGRVEVLRPKETKWTPLVAEMDLRVGDKVSTKDNSMILIKFAEGSTFRLKENSLVDLQGIITGEKEPPKGYSLKLWYGKGWLLTTRLKKSAKFMVYTPIALLFAEDRGTSFSVAVDSHGRTKAAVFKGKVRVRNLTTRAKEMELERGEACAIEPDRPLHPEKLSREERIELEKITSQDMDLLQKRLKEKSPKL